MNFFGPGARLKTRRLETARDARPRLHALETLFGDGLESSARTMVIATHTCGARSLFAWLG